MTHPSFPAARRLAFALLVLVGGGLGVFMVGVRAADAAPAASAWPDSLRVGRDLLDAGKSAAAESLAHRGLAAFEASRSPDSLLLAGSLDLLVSVLQRTGRTRRDETLAHAERVVTLRERLQGAEDPDVATSLVGLAIVLRARGDFPGSKVRFERAIAIREKARGPDHPDVAVALASYGPLLREMGDFAGSEAALVRGLAIQEKALGPDDVAVARTLNGLASLRWATGEYAEAQRLYERAAGIYERTFGPDHPETGAIYNNLGVVAREVYDPVRARASYERALTVIEKAQGPEHPNVAAVLSGLGLARWESGDTTGAMAQLERALAIYEKSYGPEHPQVAYGWNTIGILSGYRGDDPGAVRAYERAIAIREQALGGDHPLVAESEGNLAEALERMGEPARARPHAARALRTDRLAFGDASPRVANSLGAEGEVLAGLGHTDSALVAVDGAIRVRKDLLGPTHFSVAWSLLAKARILDAAGRRGEALDAALEADRIRSDFVRLSARSLAERRALQVAAQERWGLDLPLAYAAQGLDADATARVWDALVRSRALVLDAMARRRLARASPADTAIAALAAASARTGEQWASFAVRGPGAEGNERYRALLDSLGRAHEAADEALAGASPADRVRDEGERAGLREVLAALPPHSALVAFARHARPVPPGTSRRRTPPGRYVAFVHPPGGGIVALDVGEAPAIDALVEAWRGSAGHPPGGRAASATRALRERGRALARAIWTPIASRIGDATRVFVVPDGTLHLVHWGALPGARAEYLVEEGPALHVLSTERDLLPATGVTGEGLLAVGNPDYDAATTVPANATLASAETRGPMADCAAIGERRWERLPSAEREAADVAALWSAARRDSPSVLLGPDALEGAVKAQAPGHAVLHLATHGFFVGTSCEATAGRTRGIGGYVPSPAATSPTTPVVTGPPTHPLRLSGLVLAGANRLRSAAGGDDDGVLTAEEIAGLDLRAARWAVLSACDTGLGDVQSGEGVLGLRRAFQVAGARTVLMSLWAVEDDSAREWMHALYAARLEGSQTPEAVRQACREVLKQRRARSLDTHPFYWGGFVAAGDWR